MRLHAVVLALVALAASPLFPAAAAQGPQNGTVVPPVAPPGQTPAPNATPAPSDAPQESVATSTLATLGVIVAALVLGVAAVFAMAFAAWKWPRR